MNKLGLGAWGEVNAAKFLRDKGYDIVLSNYHSRFGEIDIVAADKRYIVFVEVKTRAEGSMVTGREAVNAEKQKKIVSTALLYLQNTKDKRQPRFDVIEVVVKKSTRFEVVKINHIENAFGGENGNAIF
ncbi:MAG: YraN family protein [Clostridia bacterium]|nr:YraN family protein [Clostridia bacterium]